MQGDPNASIPSVQPVIARPQFGASCPQASITFVSEASISNGSIEGYGLTKRVEAVKGCRTISKRDMKLNDAMPHMTVDPESYCVEADGVPCEAEPSTTLPGTTGYYLY